MNFLKVAAGTLFFLGIMLFLIDIFAAPKYYKVDRETVINAPAEVIFPHVQSFEKRAAWSPWAKKDPNMTKSLEGTDGTVGAIYKWSSSVKEVGVGTQEIIKIVPNKTIETKLAFTEPFVSQSETYVKLKAKDKGTKINWGFTGQNETFIERMLSFFGVINLDKQVGPDFEEGLASLKSLVESEYLQMSTKEEVKTAGE